MLCDYGAALLQVPSYTLQVPVRYLWVLGCEQCDSGSVTQPSRMPARKISLCDEVWVTLNIQEC
jgi:hypothetical protein